MTHLARYAATETSLARVLARRIERWGQTQQEQAGQEQAASDNGTAEVLAQHISHAKAAIPEVLARLKELGVLNDEAFAESRARRLTRSGKSRRASLAHLAAKGIRNPAIADDPQRELAAACVYLRRRRAGPYGEAAPEKILAAMARGGFSQATARHAMKLTRNEAESLIASLA